MRHLATAGAILLALLFAGAAPASAAHRHPIPSGRGAIVDLVTAAARRHGVPTRLALAIVDVESGFNPHARNGTSTGLGQIKPGTARDAGCHGSLWTAAANADCSARILAVLLRDARGDWRRAAAHYNQGRFARGSAGAGYARLVLARARRMAA
ncbi:MAG: transglycosylase SLT domain-containing protein [Janthinobacterium lividum]